MKNTKILLTHQSHTSNTLINIRKIYINFCLRNFVCENTSNFLKYLVREILFTKIHGPFGIVYTKNICISAPLRTATGIPTSLRPIWVLPTTRPALGSRPCPRPSSTTPRLPLTTPPTAFYPLLHTFVPPHRGSVVDPIELKPANSFLQADKHFPFVS